MGFKIFSNYLYVYWIEEVGDNVFEMGRGVFRDFPRKVDFPKLMHYLLSCGVIDSLYVQPGL